MDNVQPSLSFSAWQLYPSTIQCVIAAALGGSFVRSAGWGKSLPGFHLDLRSMRATVATMVTPSALEIAPSCTDHPSSRYRRVTVRSADRGGMPEPR